jgi:hypothetical protein
MKNFKIAGLFLFLMSSVNLFGSNKISNQRCTIIVIGVTNCGEVVRLKAVAETSGNNTTQERLCSAARDAAEEDLKSRDCEDKPAPELPYLT